MSDDVDELSFETVLLLVCIVVSGISMRKKKAEVKVFLGLESSGTGLSGLGATPPEASVFIGGQFLLCFVLFHALQHRFVMIHIMFTVLSSFS